MKRSFLQVFTSFGLNLERIWLFLTLLKLLKFSENSWFLTNLWFLYLKIGCKLEWVYIMTFVPLWLDFTSKFTWFFLNSFEYCYDALSKLFLSSKIWKSWNFQFSKSLWFLCLPFVWELGKTFKMKDIQWSMTYLQDLLQTLLRPGTSIRPLDWPSRSSIFLPLSPEALVSQGWKLRYA